MSSGSDWFRIPVSNDGQTMRDVLVSIPTPLTEQEWKRMQDILHTMKPGLVADHPERTEHHAD